MSFAGALAAPTGAEIVSMGLNSSMAGSPDSLACPPPPHPRASRRSLIELRHAAREASSRCTFGREARMHDGTVAGEHSRLDDLVVPLHRQRLRRLVDQDFQEGVEILGVEARCRGRDAARHIEMA